MVRMTARAVNSTPMRVVRPVTRGCSPEVSKVRLTAASCHRARRSVCSASRRHRREKRALSHCARGLHMAGPFERLSMRNCIVAQSVMRPIRPPRASISRTIWPFATPPTAGLHDMAAILSRSIVSSSVRQPMRAAAVAASHPACPAPTTMMSKSFHGAASASVGASAEVDMVGAPAANPASVAVSAATSGFIGAAVGVSAAVLCAEGVIAALFWGTAPDICPPCGASDARRSASCPSVRRGAEPRAQPLGASRRGASSRICGRCRQPCRRR